MKVLLDTNIIIHREADIVVNEDIGLLFKWIDNLHYRKYIHPLTLEEISRHGDDKVVKRITAKAKNYNTLQTEAVLHPNVKALSDEVDQNDNDLNDTKLINEVYSHRVDILITEDRGAHSKAKRLGVIDKVFTIDAFLEKVNAENPQLSDYSILAVKKEFFGNIDSGDTFFDSFKTDYIDFEKWFNKKAEEIAYVCKGDGKINAFLYLKLEDENEVYNDIEPVFSRKKRLKIGTFKVVLNGYKLGERFLKIVFDNVLKFKVDAAYMTIFAKGIEQERLIRLLEDFGFYHYGNKTSASGKELVYMKDFNNVVSHSTPKITYPYIPAQTNKYIVSIKPEYHTDLFPDSILRTESPNDFVENEPHRNAISKVFVSRSFERNLNTGDLIVFYRTGGYYKSVITTIGIVENVVKDIRDADHFISLCRKCSVFSNEQLTTQWNNAGMNKPFVVNFLYAYSFPKKINMKRLIEVNVIKDVTSAPRGFERLTEEKFKTILMETETDESIIVN